MLVKMERQKKRLLIVDGNAHVYRAFYGIAPLTDPKGRPINAVFGFLKTLLYIIEKYIPTHIAITFDSKSKRRKEIYPEYKANRKVNRDPMIAECLFPQLDIAKEMTTALGLLTLKVDGLEADDVICDLALKSVEADLDVLVFSKDKDFAQLVDKAGRIKLLRPNGSTPGESELGWDEVTAKFGVTPDKICDYLALAGDTADNIPGAKGIGEVTAVKLLNSYGDIKGIYNNLHNLTEGMRKKLILSEALVHISWQLAKLEFRHEFGQIDSFPQNAEFNTFAPGAKDYVASLGFNSVLNRI